MLSKHMTNRHLNDLQEEKKYINNTFIIFFYHFLDGLDWFGSQLLDCWTTVHEWMNGEKKYIMGCVQKHAL